MTDIQLKNCTIVCLCGSTKFKKDFEDINKKLTLEGHIILAPGVFGHSDNITLTSKQKDKLDRLHFKKIDLADCIYVINKDKYVGSSTRREVEYAKKLSIPVFYLE